MESSADKPAALQSPPTEVVSFDVRVSSPSLMYSAVRRIYLLCQRPNSRTWLHKGNLVARDNRPLYQRIHRMAGASAALSAPVRASMRT